MKSRPNGHFQNVGQVVFSLHLLLVDSIDECSQVAPPLQLRERAKVVLVRVLEDMSARQTSVLNLEWVVCGFLMRAVEFRSPKSYFLPWLRRALPMAWSLVLSIQLDPG